MSTYQDIIRKSHTQLSRVQIWEGPSLLEDTFYGGGDLMLVANESEVSFERLAETRTTGSFRFIARTQKGRDILDPIRACDVLPMHGVSVGEEIVWEPLGVLVISEREESVDGDLWSQDVRAVDRSDSIRRNVWKEPFQITAGQTYEAAVASILEDRASGFELMGTYQSATENTVPDLFYDAEEDPWAAACKLAQGAGCELFFDRFGAVRMIPVPDPSRERPRLAFGGSEYSVRVGPHRRSSPIRDVFNGVLCRGSAPWLLFPIQGEIWDEDPMSPTWRGGTFGERPKIIEDAVATTDAQCLIAATAEYNRIAGRTIEVDFGMVKDATLSPGAIVEDHESDVTVYYTLDSYKFPLGRVTATGVCRRKFSS